LRQARREPIAFFTWLHETYGDVAMASIGKRGVGLVNHPDYVRELLVTQHKNFRKSRTLQRAVILLGQGLLTSEGELHRRQRRLAQPAFHRDRIAAYAATMVRLSEATNARWRAGAVVDMHKEMMRLTLAIAAETLFSADVEREADEIGSALTTSMNMFGRLNSPYGPLLDRLPLPSTRRFERARERLEATIYRIIAERRASSEARDDLLSMLLSAQDEESAAGEGMTDLQVRDEVLTLFLAGHETTANALTWSWLLLADHPEVAARLRDELAHVLGGGAPSFDDVPLLVYTRQVLAEAMRLYPPAWIVGRQAIDDCEIGGYTIPAGAMVFASQCLNHRDPRFFEDPLKFDPDRWTPERESALPRYAYFPFGAGVRKCIGESFAWTEGVLVLATLAQQWRMTRIEGGDVPPRALITLRPARPVAMKLGRW
jgi:cytochrome P450